MDRIEISKYPVFDYHVYDVRDAKDVSLSSIVFRLGDVVVFSDHEAYKVVKGSVNDGCHGAVMQHLTPDETDKLKAEIDLVLMFAMYNISYGSTKEETK
ncbi:MAG: hypothetical protein HGGPFJEG_03080 [Ignavibacteria bacterium]|nr:hypothetical protein [Ignavibacteria bacterium]